MLEAGTTVVIKDAPVEADCAMFARWSFGRTVER